ncbi:hypothetical protein I4I73_29080 [Pseudonocardia sp. KRD-184]|uniref:Uncharacterized protein n=1 Tax=Pseudonocardia oceani TaxID=2792013 RepID=A0ABS6U8V1_9PSEU|nr:hypothetical protein [Pseudonocardia oceani]MBW0093295.1 hypothetical protein [Pseudonocardia oceani]MBW0100039.1 hypothetical protein [Pseudonocardia oceani]MBW0110558.1 hypothetical protein [Pseudonocardia oceani]MBW0124637.1 hypothetical protein [Pseudonocardia oceani]MBW0128679.1 hypothetical protein [Pseudonocardia oceani]
MIDRFDGWIAGLGTGRGLRVVAGIWPRSPLGPFTDVMVERADGHRLLLAPSDAVAEFVAGTYLFDEVRVGPVRSRTDGTRWEVDAAPLELAFTVGRRPALGALLRAVPRPVATDPRWISLIDLVARRVLPGVRTRGSAAGGREEFYGALDLHRVTSASVVWEGADQGGVAPVDPPVRFGFGSTPRVPSLTRVVTLVRSG